MEPVISTSRRGNSAVIADIDGALYVATTYARFESGWQNAVYRLADRDEVAKVRRAIEERGLTSHMNDTKWRKLCEAVAEELPFPPPYQAKLLVSDGPEPAELEPSPSHYGDWAVTPESSMGVFIEWLRVAPRISVHVGGLMAPRVQDCSEALRHLLKRMNIPFNERDGFFIIYGHTASAEVFD
jgi:hypothetical protein